MATDERAELLTDIAWDLDQAREAARKGDLASARLIVRRVLGHLRRTPSLWDEMTFADEAELWDRIRREAQGCRL